MPTKQPEITVEVSEWGPKFKERLLASRVRKCEAKGRSDDPLMVWLWLELLDSEGRLSFQMLGLPEGELNRVMQIVAVRTPETLHYGFYECGRAFRAVFAEVAKDLSGWWPRRRRR